MLHNLYNQCSFPRNSITKNSSYEDILGPGLNYEPFSLTFQQGFVEPYAPLYIQIYNQVVKWNEIIIVEPVVNKPCLAQIVETCTPKKRTGPKTKARGPQKSTPQPCHNESTRDTIAPQRSTPQPCRNESTTDSMAHHIPDNGWGDPGSAYAQALVKASVHSMYFDL